MLHAPCPPPARGGRSANRRVDPQDQRRSGARRRLRRQYRRGGATIFSAPAGQTADRSCREWGSWRSRCSTRRSKRLSREMCAWPSRCCDRTTGSTRSKNQIFREVLTYMLGEPRTIEPGIELILISRHLERVGDHATNIAEDVIFIVEARDVRHGSGVSISQAADVCLSTLIVERRKPAWRPTGLNRQPILVTGTGTGDEVCSPPGGACATPSNSPQRAGRAGTPLPLGGRASSGERLLEARSCAASNV